MALSLRGRMKWLRIENDALQFSMGWCELEQCERNVKCRGELHDKWAEEVDQPKLSVPKELVGRGVEVRCVKMTRNEMHRVL